jgi:hypothetical protein
MLIPGGVVIYSKHSLFCGFARYGVGLGVGGSHKKKGLWGNIQ